jgi:hypothetical protein
MMGDAARASLNRCAHADDQDRFAILCCDGRHREAGIGVDAADHHVDVFLGVPSLRYCRRFLFVIVMIPEQQLDVAAGHRLAGVLDRHADRVRTGGTIHALILTGEVSAETNADGSVGHC